MSERFHYMRLEVTVAAAIVDPDDQIVGKNMVDATLVFGWRCDDPKGASDERINKALTGQISPVLAVISTVLTQQIGFVEMGQSDEPMKANAHTVGHSISDPVRVLLSSGPVPHD